MLKLVLVDDDPDEAYLLRQALLQVESSNELIYFDNGKQFIDAKMSLRDSNCIVLLDLNMPQESGFDVLKTIRNDSSLSNTPIIMYSNSNNPQDIELSYKVGANSYVRKPQGLMETKDFLVALFNFWQRINRT